MDEMTLAVVGIDFPNEDKARSNRNHPVPFGVPMSLAALAILLAAQSPAAAPQVAPVHMGTPNGTG
jgi:hypothetical protein